MGDANWKKTESEVRRALVCWRQLQKADIDDVVQDALMTLWRRREPEPTGGGSWWAKVKATAHRVATDHWRRLFRDTQRTAWLQDETPFDDVVSDPEHDALSAERARRIEQALKTLSLAHQAAFEAYYLEDRHVSDIARDLGLSPQQVYSLLEVSRSRVLRAVAGEDP